MLEKRNNSINNNNSKHPNKKYDKLINLLNDNEVRMKIIEPLNGRHD